MSGVMESVNQRTQLVGQNRLELLLFSLEGEQAYGINVFKVREVLQCPKLNQIPQSHGPVKGVAHIRGETISVLDLSMAIGKTPMTDEDIANSFLIVAEYNRNTISFLVHKVDRIVNMQWDQIIPPPAQIGADNYLTAVFEYEDDLVEILDVEQILADLFPDAKEVPDESIIGGWKDKVNDAVVLICDDSSVARKQMQRAIESIGVKVVIKNNGKEMWEFIKSEVDSGVDLKEKYLMLISDIEMPEMDGYTLTSKVREVESLKDFHIVLHTSLSGGFNQSMVSKVGSNGFLPKFDADELANAVVDRLKQL